MTKNRKPIRSSFVLLVATVLLAPGSLAQDEGKSTADLEQQFIAVLSSDAPEAEKAIACKQLAVHGSSKAVPELAKYVADPHLSSWARIALEVIPGPEADEALRVGAESAAGTVLVGTINSIGVRRDLAAVEILVRHLKHGDPAVASAAAVALGKIGDPQGIEALLRELNGADARLKNAAAQGCILYAEALLQAGESAKAYEVYERVRGAQVPLTRIVEASRGAILTGGPKGEQLLVELLGSSNKNLVHIALSAYRELPGTEIDETLAQQLTEVDPDVAALMLYAMSDRPHGKISSTIVRALDQESPVVQKAAVRVLGRVGDETCLPNLLELAGGDDEELAALAEEAIEALPGDRVDARLVSMLTESDDALCVELLEAIGHRGIRCTDSVSPFLDHTNSEVRRAALFAASQTISQDELSLLVARLLESAPDADDSAIREALRVASVRMPDREATAADLAKAMERTNSVEAKVALLDVLGAMGGTTALQTLRDAALHGDAELQDTATRLLGRWMSVDAAPVLLDVSTSLQDDKYKVRALRGYLRLTRQFQFGDEERAAMCRNALEAATRPDEQRLVLEVLERYPSPHTLEVAKEAQQIDAISSAAKQTTSAIRKRLDEDNGN
ncbi:HEAT repeat domain-containing protein [Aeoliella sp. ICT_H6.2]|uniref:HEAT repeat domain-containing protein n=1 Tax=Aeoliella straminimaris TaxID=2954799 RepID=A0A9X2JJJ4_9BACT|nr:HEAT repeat domain-containing protein [Aeoliella straminimaris]MCO6047667.1 HEAT repeat domain-containing protein [Aeoliella straminimaris]